MYILYINIEYRIGRKRPGSRRPEFLPRMNKTVLLNAIDSIDFLFGYNNIYIGEVYHGSNTDYTGRSIILTDISDSNVKVQSIILGGAGIPDINLVVLPVAELRQHVGNFFNNLMPRGGGRRRSRRQGSAMASSFGTSGTSRRRSRRGRR